MKFYINYSPVYRSPYLVLRLAAPTILEILCSFFTFSKESSWALVLNFKRNVFIDKRKVFFRVSSFQFYIRDPFAFYTQYLWMVQAASNYIWAYVYWTTRGANIFRYMLNRILNRQLLHQYENVALCTLVI